jgi:hypothetical protein
MFIPIIFLLSFDDFSFIIFKKIYHEETNQISLIVNDRVIMKDNEENSLLFLISLR